MSKRVAEIEGSKRARIGLSLADADYSLVKAGYARFSDQELEELTDPESYVERAARLWDTNSKWEEVEKMIFSAADAGHPLALLMAYESLYQPLADAEISSIEAFEATQRCALSGHPLALFHLGQFYETGMGTKSNKEEALRFLKRSAYLGFYPALPSLARVIKVGGGNEEDVDKARDSVFHAMAIRARVSESERGCTPSAVWLREQDPKDIEFLMQFTDSNREAVKALWSLLPQPLAEEIEDHMTVIRN